MSNARVFKLRSAPHCEDVGPRCDCFLTFPSARRFVRIWALKKLVSKEKVIPFWRGGGGERPLLRP